MKCPVKISFFLMALSMASSLVAQNNVIDEIVWVVGDEAILKSEVKSIAKKF